MVRFALPLVILVLALVALRQLSHAVRWSDVRADLVAAPWPAISATLGLTAVSYASLSLYDVVSLRAENTTRANDGSRLAGDAGLASQSMAT